MRLIRRFRQAVGRASFLAILGVLCANTAISYWNSSRIDEMEELVADSYDLRLSLWRVLSSLQDAETGQRGFLLTGAPEYLEPYQAARPAYERNLAELKAKISENSETQALVKELENHAERKLAELAATIELSYERGLDVARNTLFDNSGQREMEAIRAIMTRLRDIERTRLQRRAAVARSTIATARITTIVAGLLSLALLSAAYYAATARAAAAARADALALADRRKDEFLAMLAHELRHPLAPLCAALEELETEDLDAAETRHLHQAMRRQAGLMTRLVEDLRDVSRVANGKILLDARTIDLNAAVTEAVELALPRVEAKDDELIISLAASAMPLHADIDRISQAIANLLINAAKYSDRGRRVWLSTEREGSLAVIRVRDEGMGIEPEMLGRIFEIFTQADCAFRNPEGGLGLGLHLAKNLVEMHGGSIRAHSDGPGKGSEFVIRLPLGADQSAGMTESAETSGAV